MNNAQLAFDHFSINYMRNWKFKRPRHATGCTRITRKGESLAPCAKKWFKMQIESCKMVLRIFYRVHWLDKHPNWHDFLCVFGYQIQIIFKLQEHSFSWHFASLLIWLIKVKLTLKVYRLAAGLYDSGQPNFTTAKIKRLLNTLFHLKKRHHGNPSWGLQSFAHFIKATGKKNDSHVATQGWICRVNSKQH